jgi:hypothetical protein
VPRGRATNSDEDVRAPRLARRASTQRLSRPHTGIYVQSHLAELQNAIDKAITTYAKENNLDKEQTKELRKAYDIKELRKKAESAWER